MRAFQPWSKIPLYWGLNGWNRSSFPRQHQVWEKRDEKTVASKLWGAGDHPGQDGAANWTYFGKTLSDCMRAWCQVHCALMHGMCKAQMDPQSRWWRRFCSILRSSSFKCCQSIPHCPPPVGALQRTRAGWEPTGGKCVQGLCSAPCMALWDHRVSKMHSAC